MSTDPSTDPSTEASTATVTLDGAAVTVTLTRTADGLLLSIDPADGYFAAGIAPGEYLIVAEPDLTHLESPPADPPASDVKVVGDRLVEGTDTAGRRYRRSVNPDGTLGCSWYVTDCCSAPATITEGVMNCKGCYEEVDDCLGGIPQIPA